MTESKQITIIFANRNRDAKRIRTSLKSLEKQRLQNFEVVFVDYGSIESLANEIRSLTAEFDFLRFYHFEVAQLLWNKSKAINYGILQARAPYIFVADVDIIFHPNTTLLFKEKLSPKNFWLFRLSYLSKKVSDKLQGQYVFESLRTTDYNDVNGMILAPTEGLKVINGLDEFFHFYGGEDEDLFSRLENAGFTRNSNTAKYFYHIWHQSFNGSEDKSLTTNPRMRNIRRINEKHYHKNRDKNIKKPNRQNGMGKIIKPEARILLDNPEVYMEVPNILADVEHALREELPTYSGKTVEIKFYKDPYEKSIIYYLRKILKKRTEVYCTMKVVNDIVLKEILYMYRDDNYSFKVSEDLKSIRFCIKL